ncbi:hypothetical protein [Mycobacterium sp. PSTR-4-N]|uniref:hypothetical protein n=1 Tax=Mycobacterium sp. PSTR-4-N TaxID=2917745 RepID=UPI001F14F75C|nr:hypothetical protein [Mycobacterium sp. PSTR-4-N]MCG7597833.1 hypothetical protein [Mycobacterium sp. PSTR-4-N]
MTTRSIGRRATPPSNGGRVSVEIAEPFAVFHDGEQRTGTVDNVPVAVARYWLRRGWASYAFGDALAENGA